MPGMQTYRPRRQVVVDGNGQLQTLDGLGFGFDDVEQVILEMKETAKATQSLDRKIDIYGPLVAGGLVFVGLAVIWNTVERKK